MSTQHAAALLDLGYHLVPLKPATKEPDGGFGWQDRAVSTAADVGRLVGHNLGVLGGSPVGGGRLLVLDIDAKNAAGGFESVRRLEATYGRLPPTAATVTPHGGRHLHYRVPPDVPLHGVRELLKKLGYSGLDLIGEGLFAVAPPSALPSGCYRWEWHPAEGLSVAPLWLEHLLRLGGRSGRPACDGRQRKAHDGPRGGQRTRPRASGHVEEVIERFPLAGPGQRQDAMVPAVLSLFRKGLRPEQVREVMVRWHEHHTGVFTTPCDEALRLLDDCIAGTSRNVETGKVLLAETDHLAAQAGQELTPTQVAFLCALPALPSFSPRPPSLPHSKGGLDAGTATLTRRERQFAEVLLILAGYERAKPYRKVSHSDDILATNQQIIDLFKARHGTDLSPANDNEGAGSRQFRRLKAAVISTANRAASKVELLRTVKLGERGRATVYRATGLLSALRSPVTPGRAPWPT